MTTTTLQEIENAIVAMSANELLQLYSWLDQNRPQPIDARIDAGIAAGTSTSSPQKLRTT